MEPDPLTVSPSTLTFQALALMRERKVDCLPVVDAGCLVGIVTGHDMLRVLALLLQRPYSAAASAD